MNSVSRNQHFFTFTIERIWRNDLFSTYFSRNIAATIWTTANAPTNSTCVYNLSEVKFLGDKKRTNQGFDLQVWKINSVFL